MGLQCLLGPSEADESLTAGFTGSEARADAIVRMQSDVSFEFGGEVGIMTAGAEHPKEANP
jgi:hypothetical protein